MSLRDLATRKVVKESCTSGSCMVFA